MANTLLTPTIIAKEALMQLENNLIMGASVHRDYKKEFVKIGDTVTIRKPVKFRAKDGATLDEVNVVERSTTLQINKRKHVAWNFSSQELTLTIEQYSERYIKPAMIALANQIDYDGCQLYKDVYNEVGTPGTNPDSFAEVSPAAQRLDEEAVPRDSRNLVMAPKTFYGVTESLVGLYNPQMVKGAVQRLNIGPYAGFGNVAMDQNIPTHTVGTKAGTPLMNGATAEGATQLVTDGWTASSAILKQGDIITIANVYAVNPVSGAKLDWLRQFVVTADVSSDGTGAATIPISPKIYSAAATEDYLPYQTVDALPADNAAISVLGTASTAYIKNLTFHKNAFALVTVPLVLPDSAGFKARETYNNLSIRVIKDYNVTNDVEIIRLDVMYGWKTIYADLAARLTA